MIPTALNSCEFSITILTDPWACIRVVLILMHTQFGGLKKCFWAFRAFELLNLFWALRNWNTIFRGIWIFFLGWVFLATRLGNRLLSGVMMRWVFWVTLTITLSRRIYRLLFWQWWINLQLHWWWCIDRHFRKMRIHRLLLRFIHHSPNRMTQVSPWAMHNFKLAV